MSRSRYVRIPVGMAQSLINTRVRRESELRFRSGVAEFVVWIWLVILFCQLWDGINSESFSCI